MHEPLGQHAISNLTASRENGPMGVLCPARFDAVEDEELSAHIVDVPGAEGLGGDALREAVIRHAVRQLYAKLGEDVGLRSIAEAAESDEDAFGWLGAQAEARRLGLQGPVAVAMLFLISERTASGAGESPWSQALLGAAAQRLGSSWQGDHAANTLLETHGDAFTRFIDAQRELTREKLNRWNGVTLHRAIRTNKSFAEREADPLLRPLSSFSTTVQFAVSLAKHGYDAGRGGRVVVFSAHVPTDRIVSIPSTGWGTALERELVVGVGAAGDLATITPLDC